MIKTLATIEAGDIIFTDNKFGTTVIEYVKRVGSKVFVKPKKTKVEVYNIADGITWHTHGNLCDPD